MCHYLNTFGGREREGLWVPYPGCVPSYEFRCRSCGTTFTVRRSMDESAAPAACPQGHDDTVRLLTTLGLGGAGARTVTAPAPSGGGCCGGGCGCG